VSAVLATADHRQQYTNVQIWAVTAATEPHRESELSARDLQVILRYPRSVIRSTANSRRGRLRGNLAADALTSLPPSSVLRPDVPGTGEAARMTVVKCLEMLLRIVLGVTKDAINHLSR